MEDIEMELDLGDPGAEMDEINFDPPADPLLSTFDPLVIQQELPADAEPVLNKIHIRGLDNLTTEEVGTFAREHFAEEEAKVEWIDDTSANLVYATPEAASLALAALAQPTTSSNDPSQPSSNQSTLHPLQLRLAKSFSTHPDTTLTIRTAVSTDRKKARAADESRFYLLNPEHDPRELRRRRYNAREHRRRISHDRRAGYSADMYDEDGGRSDRGRRRSSGSSAVDMSDAERYGNRRRRWRPRLRSRSPGHDAVPSRSRSPLRNAGKELLPSGPKHVTSNAGKELLSNLSRTGRGSQGVFREGDDRSASATAPSGIGVTAKAGREAKELFPPRTEGGTSTGMESLFKRSMSVPFVDGARDENGVSIRGRGAKSGEGLSIKGAGGLSIRGAASQQGEKTEAKIRELFPDRARNSGKELFGGGGGGKRERKRAEGFY